MKPWSWMNASYAPAQEQLFEPELNKKLKCEYCGSVYSNPPDNCENCGASLIEEEKWMDQET